MIRTIDIRLNAAHPELPLPEATTYQNAPSTAFLRGVPKSCGLWQITAVSVAVTFPDNSTTTRAAVLSAGDVWVATIPACATSGRTTSGLRILADGTDENGDAVTGYVLGVADLAVATFDIAPAPGETSYALRYFDNVPNPPHKGDVATVDGTLKYYDGTAWQPFAGVPSPSTSAPLMDGTASAGASAAYARGDHRHPTDTTRASKADATLTERTGEEWQYGELTVSDGTNVWVWTYEFPQYDNGTWTTEITNGPDFITMTATGPEDATSLSFTGSGSGITASGTITRTVLRGYQLGSQTDKPLASEAEAEALRNGKLDKSGGTMTGSLHMGDNFLKWRNGNLIYWLSTNGLYIWDDGDDETHSPNYIIEFPLASGTLALTAANPTAGNLAALDANGNPTDALIPAANVAMKGDIPYTLGTPTVIDTASSETVEGETVYYGAATLADRTANIVQVTAATALDELRITFPAATSGKVRDFGLRVEIGTGSAALAAPALVPIAPTGETITLENADGAIPELVDGTATAKGVTLLYFSETAPGVFVVKGEQVEEVA